MNAENFFIDPVAFKLGPLQVHWYGLMYLFAFATAWAIMYYRSQTKHSPVKRDQVEDLVLYGALGAVIGGRIGYVLFYHFDNFVDDPVWLFRVWEGGMSFHGGFLGAVAAMALFAHRRHVPFFQLLDFIAPAVPPGLGFGRLGNFINQELWGRVTDVEWAVRFPAEGANAQLRHPSQLYEAALEGFVLFIILFWFSIKPRPRGAIAGLGIFLYGCFRFAVEFTREPDAHLKADLLLGWVSRGQLLSLPMILVGLGLFVWAYSKNTTPRSQTAR